MNITNFDSSTTKKILLGLIVSTDFLSKYIATFSSEKVFDEIGASWIEAVCTDYFKKYGKAPNTEMRNLYEKAVETKQTSPAELEFVERLLVSLSRTQVEDINPDFLLDESILEANIRKVKKLAATIDETASKSTVDRLLNQIKEFRAVEAGEKQPVISLYDNEVISEIVYDRNDKQILTVPGDFGDDINPVVTQNSVTYIRAGAKGLKSYCCFSLALNALVNKIPVAIFELGDLSDSDSFSRLLTALSSRPVKQPYSPFYKVSKLDCLYNKHNKCMSINRTCMCAERTSDGNIDPDYKPCSYCKSINKPFPVAVSQKNKQISEVLSKEKASAFLKLIGERFKDIAFDVFTYSFSQCSVSDIERILAKKADSGQAYGLVIIDHFGLLKPEHSSLRMTQAWQIAELQSKLIRKISLNYGCAVVVADQTAIRQELDDDGLQQAQSYSGTQGKNQDCTAIIGLNRSREDIEYGVLKEATVLTRNANKTGIQGGYNLIIPNIMEGVFCEDSFYVSPEIQKVIGKAKEELGLVEKPKKSFK